MFFVIPSVRAFVQAFARLNSISISGNVPITCRGRYGDYFYILTPFSIVHSVSHQNVVNGAPFSYRKKKLIFMLLFVTVRQRGI